MVAIPTSTRKLRSRVEAMVRLQDETPPRPSLPRVVAVGHLIEIQPHQRTVAVRDRPLALTKSEFDLLLALGLRPSDVLTRAELGPAAGKVYVSDRALKSHITASG